MTLNDFPQITPSADDVRDQLNRILQYFAGDKQRKPWPKLTELLSHIVLETLADKPISAESIARAVFKRESLWRTNSRSRRPRNRITSVTEPVDPNPDPNPDPIVRSNLHNLRDALRKYYLTYTDPVTISLPKGQFRAHFETNSSFSPYVLLQQAHNLRTRDGRHFSTFETAAMKLIEEALQALSTAPNTSSSALLYLYAASVAVDQIDLTSKDDHIPLADLAFSLISRAELLDKKISNLAVMWTVLARIGMSSGQWLRAASAFNCALSLNRAQVERAPAFLHFLVCTGQPLTAIRLSRERTLQDPSATTLSYHAYLLYTVGDYAQAIITAQRSLQFEPLSDASVYYILSLMALNRNEEALAHIRSITPMMPFGTFSPGLTSLVELLVSEQHEQAINLARNVIQDEPTVANGVFWFQCIGHMFAYVTLDQPAEAIVALAKIPIHHPYMNLIHLNPELNRFRSHPMFVKLQQQALPPTLQQLLEIVSAEPSCLIPENAPPDELPKWRERLGLGQIRKYMQSGSALSAGQPDDT